MFEVGSMVLCIKHFESEKKRPEITFPQLGEYYWVRDVIYHGDSKKLGLRFYEIRNELYKTTTGFPDEPTFNSENFKHILSPLPKLNVDKIIKDCLKK